MSSLVELRERVIARERELAKTFDQYRSGRMPDDVLADVRTKTAELSSWTGELQALSKGHPTPAPFVIPDPSGGGEAPDALRVLQPTDRLATKDAPFGVGDMLRGIVLGDWSRADVGVKTMSGGSNAGGGYMVPDPLATRVIDKARNAAVVMQAGALTVPMPSSTLRIARVEGDPTAGWKSENSAATASDITLGQVTLTARTLVAYVKSSVELIEDASEIQNTIENALAAALALELDRVALRGSGSAPEPRGILNTSGIHTQTAVGTPSSYVAFADTPTRTLRESNAPGPFAFVAAPRTFTSLESLVTGISGDKTRLAPPPAWEAFRRFSTNQIPTNLGVGTDESEAYIGDFSQMLVGIRQSLVIEASREATQGGDNAFAQMQVHIRAYLRADVALAQPSHFVVLSGIK